MEKILIMNGNLGVLFKLKEMIYLKKKRIICLLIN